MTSTAEPPPAASDDQTVRHDQSDPNGAALADLGQPQDDPDRAGMGQGEQALRQLRDDGVI